MISLYLFFFKKTRGYTLNIKDTSKTFNKYGLKLSLGPKLKSHKTKQQVYAVSAQAAAPEE